MVREPRNSLVRERDGRSASPETRAKPNDRAERKEVAAKTKPAKKGPAGSNEPGMDADASKINSSAQLPANDGNQQGDQTALASKGANGAQSDKADNGAAELSKSGQDATQDDAARNAETAAEGLTNANDDDPGNSDDRSNDRSNDDVNMGDATIHEYQRQAAAVDFDAFANQADEISVPQTDTTPQGGQRYQAVHYWPKAPTFPWAHDEIPDPSRNDAVERSTHRYRYEGASNRINDSRYDIRAAMKEEALRIDGVAEPHFDVRPPFVRNNATYVDVVVFETASYEKLKALGKNYNGRPLRLAFSGAPLTPDQIVFRVGGLDVRIRQPDVAAKVRAIISLQIEITDIWGMHSEKGVMGQDYRLQFEGIIYFLGKRKRLCGTLDFGPYVDLSDLEYGGRLQPLHWTKRPNYCTRCRPSMDDWHRADACPRKRSRYFNADH